MGVCDGAQVADTLGKSFQIHLFRSLCADDTCTTLPKMCHNVSHSVCSSDPTGWRVHECAHVYVYACYVLCLVVFSVCLFMLG